MNIQKKWRQLLNREDVVIVDTETTGLDKQAEIVEIAVINTFGEVLRNTLVMPVGEIPQAAYAVHGIDKATLLRHQSPSFGAIMPGLKDLLAGKTVCAYNAAFDVRMLSQSAALYGEKFEVRNPNCLKLDYAAHRQIPGPCGDWKWHRLSEAAEHERVEVVNVHRALSDCWTALDLMQAVATG